MIAIGEWLSPTRIVGLSAYSTAAICCGVAWMREETQGSNRRLAGLLTLLETTLLLDITFNWRWMLHEFVGDVARRRHEYGLRQAPQVIALVILAALLLLGLGVTQRYFRLAPAARLAIAGTLLSMVVWCVEVVSLHAVDHILYHQIGKWMVVSGLWVLACTMASIGMLSLPAPMPAMHAGDASLTR